jgi:hypothetical protein
MAKKTTPSSKVRKTENISEGRLGPTSAKIMYVKMKNGEDMVALVSTLKDHNRELMEDIQTRETDAKSRKGLLALLEKEKATTRPFVAEKDDDKVFVLYYPAVVTYMPAGTQKMPAMYLSPWVSTAVTVNQLFRVSADQILTMFDPADGVKTYYSEVMKKMIFAITLSLHQETLASIDPKSELGKIVKGLQQNQPRQQKPEDEDDDYIAAMLEKARKPLAEDVGDINEHKNTPPSVAAPTTTTKPANTVPSIIVAGDKKTLH